MIKLNNFNEDVFEYQLAKFRTYMERPACVMLDDNEMVFSDEKGFISFKIIGEILFICKFYGDGKYYRDIVLRALAKKSNKIKEIRSRCRRNPKAYERLFRCECYHTEMVDGKPLYFFKKKVGVDNGHTDNSSQERPRECRI